MIEITKKEALKLYDRGHTVYFMPSKLTPNVINTPSSIQENKNPCTFFNFIKNYEAHYCNKNVGLKVKFWSYEQPKNKKLSTLQTLLNHRLYLQANKVNYQPYMSRVELDGVMFNVQYVSADVLSLKKAGKGQQHEYTFHFDKCTLKSSQKGLGVATYPKQKGIVLYLYKNFENYPFVTTEQNIKRLYKLYYGWTFESSTRAQQSGLRISGEVVLNRMHTRFRGGK